MRGGVCRNAGRAVSRGGCRRLVVEVGPLDERVGHDGSGGWSDAADRLDDVAAVLAALAAATLDPPGG